MSEMHKKGKERLRLGSNTAVSIIAAGAILVMANYLAMRHYSRADWTAAGLYTPSDKTAKVLGALDKEVSLYVLWSQGDGRYPDVKEVLDNYRSLSSNLKVEMIDPDMNPERMQFVIDRYGAKIQTDMAGNVGIEAGVFAVSGEKVKFVSSEEFESFDESMFTGGEEGEPVSEFKAEQALTSAVMRVSSDEQVTVCFTQGHGEWALKGYGQRSMGHIETGLTQDSYQVKEIPVSSGSKVDSECAAVVVAGPERTFLEDEAKVLADYLDEGGKLLLLLDPLIEGDRFLPTGLERLTASKGIELHKDFMLETDPRRLVSDTPVTFLASEFTTHPTVKSLGVPDSVDPLIKEQMGAYPVVFSGACSMEPKEGAKVVADVLARSSSMSWGEQDISSMGSGVTVPQKDQYDTEGPAILAMASAAVDEGDSDEIGGRLVVVGDSDFLSEELFVNAGLYNRDFWSGLVGWLTARQDMISIAPKNPENVHLNLTEEDVGTIWKILAGQILLILTIGIVIWFRRRR